MDVTRMLETDHRMVEGLFAQILEAKGDERAALVQELATALEGHMELEETVVYPQMGSVTGPESVEEGETEHELARKTLAEMVALAPEQPGFEAALEAVKAGIEHHVEEEESTLFPQMRSEGADAIEAMTQPFLSKRAELGMKVNPVALAVGATKEQLVEEAAGVDIVGAASMNKDELAEALADAG
ncbi:MAG: hemerythrin domain-containing protein [Actinomycetota bacterium]